MTRRENYDGSGEMKFVTVPKSCAGMRADIALSGMFAQSRSRTAALIKSGDILINGKKSKPSAALEGGEKIAHRPPSPEPISAEPEDIALDVIFEDDEIIVVNKPAGMAVHPGAGRKNSTLANALAYRCRSLSTAAGLLRPGIVHRLDKDTSGVIVVAKNDTSHASLASGFARREVKKKYFAIVCGEMKAASGVFSAAVGRSRANRKKMSGKISSGGRDALTHWRAVENFSGWTFASASPKTGRTHQIRVHFSEAGHPLAGDLLYCPKSAALKFKSSGLSKILGRHALHAARITFAHPASGREVSFAAPLPGDMTGALSFLRRREMVG